MLSALVVRQIKLSWKDETSLIDRLLKQQLKTIESTYLCNRLYYLSLGELQERVRSHKITNRDNSFVLLVVPEKIILRHHLVSSKMRVYF